MEKPAALIVTRRPAKEMADGTLRVQIDVEPNDRRAFLDMFPDQGGPIAVAALSQGAVTAHMNGTAFATVKKKSTHGNFAKWMVQSGQFRNKAIWKATGTDKEYLAWCRTQPCCTRGKTRCGGDVVAAHVRRIANGAGEGIKPQYSAVPMCGTHHQIQHHEGESAFGGKEVFDRARVEQLQYWCRETMRKKLGVATLAEASPQSVAEYFTGLGLTLDVPKEFL